MNTLRPYQQEALAAIDYALDGGTRRPLLALPTGSGKTVVFTEKIRQVVEAGGRALILVHRAELIEQTKDTLAWIAPDLCVGVVKAERDEYTAPVIIASVQTVARPARLARLGTDFRLVVVDEAHHATAPTWRKILGALNGTPVLGVTATPFRGDGTPLAGVFDQIVYQKTILDMIASGWLCDLRAVRVQVHADFERLRTVGGEINQGQAGTMLLDANAPADIVEAYKRHALGRKALCFTPTIAVAEAVAEEFRKAGVQAEALSDNSTAAERKAILRRLKTGKTLVVPNCAILTEGFDAPDVSAIIIARPTKSRQLYTQMIGRGTRKAPGKADCLILDTTGATARHDIQSMGSMFGGVKPKPGESLLEAKVRVAVEKEAAELAEYERVKLVSTRVNLVRAQQLYWTVAPSGDLFVLGLGRSGHLRLVPEDDGSNQSWLLIRKLGATDGYRETVVSTHRELSDATDAAEEMARAEDQAGRIVDKNAEWRSQPIVPGSKQCRMADRQRIRYDAGATKGELSDLLTLRFARRDEDHRTGRRKPMSGWVRKIVAQKTRQKKAAARSSAA